MVSRYPNDIGLNMTLTILVVYYQLHHSQGVVGVVKLSFSNRYLKTIIYGCMGVYDSIYCFKIIICLKFISKMNEILKC